MTRPATFIALIVLTLSSAAFTNADGIQDNIPENVRRIPELGVPVPEDRAASMRTSLGQLQEKIAAINASKDAAAKSLLPDVMIFERAVRCALDYQEFFDVKDLDKADALLLEGIKRADQLLAGKPEWMTQKGLVVRGYISRIDNTVQPYGLVIPPTYANLTRFHGVFAPTSRLRDKVVPRPASTVDGAEPPAEPQVSTTSPPPSAPAASPKSTSVPSPYRLDWASLLKRVFGVDVLKCSRCQGQMRLIACIEEPDVAKKILEHLGLPSEPLPTARAQAPPVTLELFPEA